MSENAFSAASGSVAGAEWLARPGVAAVFKALSREGQEARAVGGAPRNTLLGLPVSDVDFAATAKPKDIIRLARKAGLKPVPTGLEHGTITVVAEGVPYEVTTLRRDVESHGRHATVAFTRDWAADAARRDFTINALYAAADGRLYDPLGGLSDIEARRVRFINSARERIREDYLRILRFFRFTADYSAGPPDADGLTACIAERGGLSRLSAERIRMELLRILVTRKPLAALQPMAEAGLLVSLLGGVVHLQAFARLAAVEEQLSLTAAPMRRLGLLAVRVSEDAQRLARRLRLSKAEAGRLEAIAAHRPRLTAAGGELAGKEALYRLGRQTFEDRVLMAWAMAGDGADVETWERLFRLPDRWTAPRFPVTGRHLSRRGVEPGPQLGVLLRELEARWIASEFKLSADELLQELG